MIAEDEDIEREALEKIITQADLPIQEIMKASDGEDALIQFQRHQPDIILMDINMPKLDGLSALKEIRKIEKKETACLVLTSYDYFTYAQKAIRLGVEDFILKPASVEVIVQSLHSLIEKLKMEQNTFTQTKALVNKVQDMKPLVEEECIFAIMMRQNDIQLQRSFQLLNISMKQGVCLVFNKEEQDKIKLTRIREYLEDVGYRCLFGVITNQYMCFILSMRTMSSDEIMVLENVLKEQFYMGQHFAFGSIKHGVEQLHESFKEAQHALLNRTKKEERLTDFGHLWSSQLFQALEEGKKGDVITRFSQALLLQAQERIPFLYTQVCQLFINQCMKDIDISSKDLSFTLTLLENEPYQEKTLKIQQGIQQIFHIVNTHRYENTNYIVKKTYAYIKENYNQPISLQDVAQHLQVTPTYISRLLNQESHRNFTDTINDYRIKKAKQLIREHVLLKDVAYQVGFHSPSYFTRIFKKLTGMSPKDYSSLFS